jgi:hypothetical protein
MAKTYWLKTVAGDGDGQPHSGFNHAARCERQTDELIGLIKGVLSDGVLVPAEADFLRNWFMANQDSCTCFPGQQIFQRIERIYSDGTITEEEREDLQALLEQVTGNGPELPPVPANPATKSVFEEPEPNVAFPGTSFAFTGKFVSGTRQWCVEQVQAAGGMFHDKPNKQTHVLVVGTLGSRDWVHSSFGRKIEAALQWRPPLKIVSEKHWCACLPKPA